MRTRSRLSVVIGCWLALSMAVAAAETSAGGPAPSAHFPQARHEFSSVPEGIWITHDFRVENRGDAPLVITRVKAG